MTELEHWDGADRMGISERKWRCLEQWLKERPGESICFFWDQGNEDFRATSASRELFGHGESLDLLVWETAHTCRERLEELRSRLADQISLINAALGKRDEETP